jgi:NAD(P)-dependent dehydrogenase (short-subunit alcohol dehydrogenase family)
MTVATGLRPENHGIVADWPATLDGQAMEPVGSEECRAATLWELADAAGPARYPAEFSADAFSRYPAGARLNGRIDFPSASRPGPSQTREMDAPAKVAVVTGASSGIGRDAARGLVAAGFRVVLAGRREDALAETAKLCSSDASLTLICVTNVRDPASVRALFARTKEAFGRIDVLFNNAGLNVPPGPLEELAFDRWGEVVETILNGSFLCTQEAVRMMKSQTPRGGRIINNGSISAHVPRPHGVAYTAAKHAITGLTKSTALEGREFDIACGQIDIGNAETAMGGRFRKGVLQANGTIAPEPTMDLKHVTEAVVYMATLPLDVNVPSLTVMATKMPFIGRG